MKGAIGKNSINNSIVASDNIFAWAIDLKNGARGSFRAATGEFFQFCVSGHKKKKKKENQVRKKKEKKTATWLKNKKAELIRLFIKSGRWENRSITGRQNANRKKKDITYIRMYTHTLPFVYRTIY